MMARCITCGTPLHPERARKYNYCTARECQEKNAKGLTMVAVGMNKAADEFLILDEITAADLASGKYRDQRRGSFGTSAPAPAPQAPSRAAGPSGRSARRAKPERPRRPPALAVARPPWTERQERLALIYNEQGLRPGEIADKLGVSAYTATQIILAARSRAQSDRR
jgi:DNA-directed RNA polymerase subunit N (RpoN/RPB10)